MSNADTLSEILAIVMSYYDPGRTVSAHNALERIAGIVDPEGKSRALARGAWKARNFGNHYGMPGPAVKLADTLPLTGVDGSRRLVASFIPDPEVSDDLSRCQCGKDQTEIPYCRDIDCPYGTRTEA